jgi:hypothetical protein
LKIIYQAVVGRVLKQTAEEVGPGHVVQGVLSRLDCSGNDLCVQVVCQDLKKTGLDRERFVEKLFVEMFLHVKDEHAGNTVVVVLRSA